MHLGKRKPRHRGYKVTHTVVGNALYNFVFWTAYLNVLKYHTNNPFVTIYEMFTVGFGRL